MNGACNSIINFDPAPWGPGKWSKGQRSFNFNYKVNLKDFLYQTLCLFSQNKRYKFCCLGHAPGVGLCGAGGAEGSNNFFSNIVMWYIKSTEMTRRTESKYNFHPWVKLVTLGMRSKGQISLNCG